VIAIAIVAIASLVGTIGLDAQHAAQTQKIDAEYTAKIKEALQDPRITTELVDHLPASDTVPTPLKFLGRYIGQPGELTYASPALATTGHLGGELFKQIARVNILHVPYKGAGSAISNLLAGEISLMYSSPPAVIMHIRAGKLKALGVTGSKRAAQAPDIPTFDESGVTGVEAYDWYGILAPAGTPKPIIDALNAQTVRILQMPDVSDRFASTQFAEPVGSTPDELQRFMRAEIDRWARVIRQANIRAE